MTSQHGWKGDRKAIQVVSYIATDLELNQGYVTFTSIYDWVSLCDTLILVSEECFNCMEYLFL